MPREGNLSGAGRATRVQEPRLPRRRRRGGGTDKGTGGGAEVPGPSAAHRRVQVRPPRLRLGAVRGSAADIPVRRRPGAVLHGAVRTSPVFEPQDVVHAPDELRGEQEE